MLTVADYSQRNYTIGVNELTGIGELLSDLSYVVEAPPGRLVFDFTHTASNLTQAIATEYLPGHFGFHPLDRTIEQLSFIGRLVEMPLLTYCPHEVSVVLPAPSSHLGQFFSQLGVFKLMVGWKVLVETHDIWESDGARDDETRRVLIPLTDIRVNSAGLPDAVQVIEVRHKITDELLEVFGTADALTELSEMICGIVEGIANLVRGGLVASLYFPTTGYFELSVMNRTEGTMGAEPNKQLDALVSELEAAPPAFEKVLDWVTRCYGTLQFSNGFASVLISADGSFATMVERTGLPSIGIPGPRATVVLQLPPKSPILWEPFAYERVANMWSTILN
jgi:hypothetical protein